MSSEWQPTTLAKFADINPKRPIEKGTIAPFIEMAALPVHSRDVSFSDVAERSFSGGGSKFTNGDTLLARITPCLENGKTALISCLPLNINGHGSTEFIVLAPQIPTDRNFLYYLARSEEFRTFAISRMEGTSGRQRVPNGAVAQFSFLCPPETERKAIGELLAILDDRIYLLRETNATLEAIAQALFKSWFVDFDPVHANQQGRIPEGAVQGSASAAKGRMPIAALDEATAALFPDSFEESELGLVPRGWQYVSLKEVVSIFDSKRIPLAGQDRVKRQGPYPYYGAAALMDSVDDYIFDGVYLLTGEDGSVADEQGYPIIQYVWGKIWVNNHAHVLQGKNGVATEHVMLSLKRTNIQPFITGAVQAKLSQANMWRITFLQPSREISESFGRLIEPLYARLRHNSEQAKTLATLRDTLLPRLISGQLRLPEAEAMVEQA